MSIYEYYNIEFCCHVHACVCESNLAMAIAPWSLKKSFLREVNNLIKKLKLTTQVPQCQRDK